MKLVRLFIFSAAGLLFLTGMAKVFSGFGHARVWEISDAVFHISNRILFWIVGMLELAISMYCIFGKQFVPKLLVIAWIATGFCAYRISMPWVGYKKPCPCLGTLADALHIQVQTADIVMKIILAYLLIGSYASLFWLWQQSKKRSQVT